MASKTLLTSVAGRNAILGGITAGTVDRAEVEYHVLKDNEKRRHRVPVVVEGRRFDSVTEGARWLHRFTSQKNTGARTAIDSYREIDRCRKNITNWCNADNIEGYYWAE